MKNKVLNIRVYLKVFKNKGILRLSFQNGFNTLL